MRKNNLKKIICLISLILMSVLILPAAASAQTFCKNTSISGTHDNVIVDGGPCTIGTIDDPDTLVRGSVMMTNGGTLTAVGAQINGSVIASGAGDLTLEGGTMVSGAVLVDSSGTVIVLDAMVLGDLSIVNSGDVVINPTEICPDPGPDTPPANNVNSVKIQSSGMLTLTNACVGSVDSADSEAISITDTEVFPGSVIVSRGNGGLTIIGSTVEGEVKVIETAGAVSADAGTTIDGAVSVKKGWGDVTLAGTTLAAGDLIAIEQAGVVTLDGAALTTSLSDLKVVRSGDVILKNIETDSDTTLTDNGDVSITGSTFGSDVLIKSNGKVTVGGLTPDLGNSFSLEDVMISNNNGPVFLEGNTDLNFSIIENNAVTVNDNTFTDAEVSKNTGGVSINRNKGAVLKCSDNNPAPDGSWNAITELADGQCEGF